MSNCTLFVMLFPAEKKRASEFLHVGLAPFERDQPQMKTKRKYSSEKAFGIGYKL